MFVFNKRQVDELVNLLFLICPSSCKTAFWTILLSLIGSLFFLCSNPASFVIPTARLCTYYAYQCSCVALYSKEQELLVWIFLKEFLILRKEQCLLDELFFRMFSRIESLKIIATPWWNFEGVYTDPTCLE